LVVPPHIAFGAITGAVLGGINAGVVASASDAKGINLTGAIIAGTFAGAAGGAVSAAVPIGAFAQGRALVGLAAAVGFGSGAAGNLVGQAFGKCPLDFGSAAQAGGVSAFAAALGAAVPTVALEGEAVAGVYAGATAAGNANIATLFGGIFNAAAIALGL
jgi:hypothetical protein